MEFGRRCRIVCIPEMARTQIVVVSDDVPLRAGPLRDAGPATGRDRRGLEVVAVRRFRDVLIDEQPDAAGRRIFDGRVRSEEHTSELQSLMRISYAVFCLTKKTQKIQD